MSLPLLINHIGSLKSTLLYYFMLLGLGYGKIHFPSISLLCWFSMGTILARDWKPGGRQKKPVFFVTYRFHQHLSSKGP